MTISESTITEIKLIDPAQLAARNHLTAIREGEYVCPLCGNGGGKDGTGIKPADLGDHWSYHCFKCGKKFDNITVLALSYGLDAGRDFVEICKRAAVEFGINLDAAQTFEKKVASPPVHPSNVAAEPDPAKIELIRADIAEAQQNLNAAPMKARRGLTLETLRRFGCGYLPKWTRPSSRLDGTYCTPTPRLIVPSGDHYLARLTVPLDTYDKKAQQYIHEKEHAGNKDVPFNIAAALNTNQNFICVFEGEINAISFWQELQLPVVALGGTACDKFIDGYTEQLKAKSKRVLILFDSDKGGRDGAEELRAALLKNGIPAVAKFLPDGAGDWNDYLRAALEKGEPMKIARWYESECSNLKAEFEAIEKEIQAKFFLQMFDNAPSPKFADPYQILDSGAPQKFAEEIFPGDGTGAGMAERLLMAFGKNKFRRCFDLTSWFIYDGRGTWQNAGNTAELFLPYVRKLANYLSKHIRPAVNGDNSKPQHDQLIVSKLRGNKGALGITTGLLGCDGIFIKPADLEHHPELLNVQNGVIDLHTGKLYPHDPKYYFTRQAPVIYVPGCHNPDVDSFMYGIQPDDKNRAALIDFLAYCLTGETNLEKFAFFFGTGRNGKGTLTLTMQRLLGDYAVEIPTEFLMAGRQPRDPNSPSPVEASLCHARFAVANEIELGRQINAALLKNLSGGDKLTFRPPYAARNVTVDATAKILLSGNYEPNLPDANDIALRKRLLVYPFEQCFAKSPDLHLKEKLATPFALTGLLSLLVEANVARYKRGGSLLVSSAADSATEKFFARNDWLGDFLDANYVFDTNGYVLRKTFHDQLRAACPKETRNLTPTAIDELVLRLSGISKTRKDRGIAFVGIKQR